MGSLKDKRFRYGTFSTAMILVAIALFLFVNLLGGEFNRTFDLTQEQLFTLTTQSRNFLDRLDMDVTVTFVAPIGQEDELIAPIVTALLAEYAAASRFITVEHRDPMINPAFIHEMAYRANMEAGIPNNSVIVQSATGIRVLTPNDMFTFDWQGGRPLIRSFDFEAEITRAINHVIQGAPPVVYMVTGSGEPPLPPGLERFLTNENFEIREVNLVTDEVPETAEILFLMMPTRDWTEVKAQRIQDFIDDEGRAFMAFHFLPVETPNLDSVLAAYRVALGDYFILEGDSRQMFMAPDLVIPGMSHHQILDPVYNAGLTTLLMQPIAIEPLATGRISATAEPLFVTSRAAQAVVPEGDNIMGPFVTAVAVTDQRFVQTTETSKFVLVGNMLFLSDQAAAFIGQGNYEFVLSSLRWLSDQPQGIWVPTRRPPGTAPLVITRMEANIMVGAAMVAVPIVSLAIGFFIWLRRRHS